MSDRLTLAEDSPGPSPKTPAKHTRLLAWLRKELERCRWGWEAGAVDALWDALRTCEEHNLPLPDWMHKALAQVVAGYATTRGRSKSRRMMDVHDLVRYDLVDTILESRPGWVEEAQYLRDVLAQRDSPGMNVQRRKDLEHEVERLERLVKATSWTDGRIFLFAAAELARDHWHGTVCAETVRASYKRVKKRVRKRLSHDPKGRYYFGLTLWRKIEAAGHESAATRIAGGVADPPLRMP